MQPPENFPDPECFAQLLSSAFEALLLNPGSTYDQWSAVLMEQYALDLIDTYGTDQEKIEASLPKLWLSPYHDPYSNQTHTLSDWSRLLSSQSALKEYYNNQQ